MGLDHLDLCDLKHCTHYVWRGMESQKKTFCKIEFLKDQNGQEVLLKDGQFQVMMEWERPYMESCIEVLEPQGDVLEVGFGCGYSASAIQCHKPKSHTIIEYHPVVAEKAREWAREYSQIQIVENTWQEALGSLGIFDAIFFDDYPLQTPDQTRRLEQQVRGGTSVLEENQTILASLQSELIRCSLPSTHAFSPQDIDEFVEQLSSFIVVEEAYVLTFLRDFESQGILTQELIEYALNKCVNRGILSNETAAAYGSTSSKPKPVSHDRFYHFFWECYNNHMKKGSRFSCYLEDPTSKFMDDRFLEEIINHPNLEFREKTIAIKPSADCKYYSHQEVLVILIEKMS